MVRTKLQKHFNATVEGFFDVAIGWPGDASNYNEDKRLAVAARMQNKAIVKWDNNESNGWDFWYLAEMSGITFFRLQLRSCSTL